MLAAITPLPQSRATKAAAAANTRAFHNEAIGNGHPPVRLLRGQMPKDLAT